MNANDEIVNDQSASNEDGTDEGVSNADGKVEVTDEDTRYERRGV